MELSNLNWLAVFVAALAAFILGALWYSPPVFAKPWMRGLGMDPANPPKVEVSMPVVFSIAFTATFIMAITLALFLDHPGVNALTGAHHGLLMGFGLISMAFVVNAQFDRTKPVVYLINAGYMISLMALMGVIIGAWR